jgi:hypothetical protein
MSLDKAIRSGKEHRQQYPPGSKRNDATCRNHGSCPWCRRGRQHRAKRQQPVEEEQSDE